MQHMTVEWSELNAQGLDAANELVRLTVERLRPASHVDHQADKVKNLGKLTTTVKKMVCALQIKYFNDPSIAGGCCE